MPTGTIVLASTERICLEYLTGNPAHGQLTFRVAGLEIVLAALGKVLVPMVCAFASAAEFDQYGELPNLETLSAARQALERADLLPTPRVELSVIRDRAIAVAINHGLSEQRARELVERAFEAIQYQLPARTR